MHVLDDNNNAVINMETLGLNLISPLINSPFTIPRIYSKKHFRHKLWTKLCISLSRFCKDLKTVHVKCKFTWAPDTRSRGAELKDLGRSLGNHRVSKMPVQPTVLRAGSGLSSTPCSEQQLRQQKWGWQCPPGCSKPGETKVISRYSVFTQGP